MILKQYYLGCLAHASYLIADERTKQAVVVDPQPSLLSCLEAKRAERAEQLIVWRDLLLIDPHRRLAVEDCNNFVDSDL